MIHWLQAIESRLVIVRALAEQWFGVFMRAKAPADNWLLMGLAGWLEDQFVKKFMGRNEYIYRYRAYRGFPELYLFSVSFHAREIDRLNLIVHTRSNISFKALYCCLGFME